MKRAKVEANERRENAPLLTLQKGETAHASYILVHDTETALSYPAGPKARKKAVHAFAMGVERKETSMASGVKVSYAKSKAFWDEYKKKTLEWTGAKYVLCNARWQPSDSDKPGQCYEPRK